LDLPSDPPIDPDEDTEGSAVQGRGVKRDRKEAQEQEEVVEKYLNKLFSSGHDDVAFLALEQSLLESNEGMPREAIEAALEAMEAGNKILFREGVIVLI
jgi:hypothetical protein